MKVIYAHEDVPETIVKSIFLAGPTPRNKDLEGWRNDALKILEDKGYDGHVFIPEPRDGKWEQDYDAQVDWEERFLNMADCIVFWVPRDISSDDKGLKMPAFTTNVEYGAWCDSGKIVFGSPSDLKKRKNTYLKYYADKYNVPFGETLTETLENAMEMIGDGSERNEGEVYVPQFVWKTPSFQSWYKAQTDAGNKLENAEVLYSFRPGFKNFVFLWVLKVSVYITSENRSKTNEFVLARPDISTVLLYKKEENVLDCEIVIVKEFRSPAATPDGFIRELSGGSSWKPNEEPVEVAAEEVHEETGFYLKSERLKFNHARQLAGTLSSHKSHLFSAELDEEEIKWFKSQDGIVHGNEEDSERTFIEVKSVKELIDNDDLDWTSLGQILSVLIDNE
jgi:8-oxo-dGTP pyrophosphatase MutT (NUDIX family)